MYIFGCLPHDENVSILVDIRFPLFTTIKQCVFRLKSAYFYTCAQRIMSIAGIWMLLSRCECSITPLSSIPCVVCAKFIEPANVFICKLRERKKSYISNARLWYVLNITKIAKQKILDAFKNVLWSEKFYMHEHAEVPIFLSFTQSFLTCLKLSSSNLVTCDSYLVFLKFSPCDKY